MKREITPPTREEVPGIGGGTITEEKHPSWALASVSRVSTSPGGSVLFDSDLKHNHTIVVRIGTASRRRDLNHDYIHREREFLEFEMSLAQWASFVSSGGVGDGVPCTIRRREDEVFVPGEPLEPRLGESIDEVEGAAERTFAKIKEAFDAYVKTKRVAELRNLRAAIENARSNLTFTANAMSKHAENVVEKARSDIEATILSQAKQLGIEPGDLEGVAQLPEGETEQ